MAIRIFSSEPTPPDPPPNADGGSVDDTDQPKTIDEKIEYALKQVYDPEIPVSIYDLGLIYKRDYDPEAKRVHVVMTLTTPHCPEAQVIPAKVRQAILELPEVDECDVEITWEPQWTKDMMTDAAKLHLGLM